MKAVSLKATLKAHVNRTICALMSSVSSVNPGVADLLQTFWKNGTSPVSTALSSSGVQSALAIASPGDLVQLSSQALQLQQVAGLFGPSEVSNGTAATQHQPTATSPQANETFAEQEVAALFGTDSVGSNSTISLLG